MNTVRVGSGTTIHLAYDGATVCGAEGGRGRTARSNPRPAPGPVTCRRCDPSATPAQRSPRTPAAPAASASRYDRRAFLTAAIARLEAAGDTERAAQARADLAAL